MANRITLAAKKFLLTVRLKEGGAPLFSPPTTAAELFTNAEVNN
jgi:hypothetical protein